MEFQGISVSLAFLLLLSFTKLVDRLLRIATGTGRKQTQKAREHRASDVEREIVKFEVVLAFNS